MPTVVFHCQFCGRETFRGKTGLDDELKESWKALCEPCSDAVEARYSRPAGLPRGVATLGDEILRPAGHLARTAAAVEKIGKPVAVLDPDLEVGEHDGIFLVVRPGGDGSPGTPIYWHEMINCGADAVSGFAFTPDGDPLPFDRTRGMPPHIVYAFGKFFPGVLDNPGPG